MCFVPQAMLPCRLVIRMLDRPPHDHCACAGGARNVDSISLSGSIQNRGLGGGWLGWVRLDGELFGDSQGVLTTVNA